LMGKQFALLRGPHPLLIAGDGMDEGPIAYAFGLGLAIEQVCIASPRGINIAIIMAPSCKPNCRANETGLQDDTAAPKPPSGESLARLNQGRVPKRGQPR
jgi:hypothetical protein